MAFEAGPHKPDPEADAKALDQRSNAIAQQVKTLEALDYKLYLGAQGDPTPLTREEFQLLRNIIFNVMKFYPNRT